MRRALTACVWARRIISPPSRGEDTGGSARCSRCRERPGDRNVMTSEFIPARHHIFARRVEAFVKGKVRAASDGDGVGAKGSKPAPRPAKSKCGIRRVNCADERRTAAVIDRGAGIQTVNEEVLCPGRSIDYYRDPDVNRTTRVEFQAGSKVKVNESAAADDQVPVNVQSRVANNNHRMSTV